MSMVIVCDLCGNKMESRDEARGEGVEIRGRSMLIDVWLLEREDEASRGSRRQDLCKWCYQRLTAAVKQELAK